MENFHITWEGTFPRRVPSWRIYQNLWCYPSGLYIILKLAREADFEVDKGKIALKTKETEIIAVTVYSVTFVCMHILSCFVLKTPCILYTSSKKYLRPI